VGTFKEHIQQSQNNIRFLSKISTNLEDCWDWQVTVCFYSALHLINAHVVNKFGANYLSHSKVDEIINPFNATSIARLDEKIYISYTKLLQLSRRSRYLLSENFKKGDNLEIQIACATYSKHLKKAIFHLDVIINFVKNDYEEKFEKAEVRCIDLKGNSFENFTIVN
jgi:hypothetical protein